MNKCVDEEMHALLKCVEIFIQNSPSLASKRQRKIISGLITVQYVVELRRL